MRVTAVAEMIAGKVEATQEGSLRALCHLLDSLANLTKEGFRYCFAYGSVESASLDSLLLEISR